MGKDLKELFGRSGKSLAKSSIGDITGSSTPIESSEYIQEFIEEKLRFLPTVDYATASNFAFYGSAEQYATDTIQRIHNTYPYDGSLTEKMAWLNESSFYDLYIFEKLYPRTVGYAVFSPSGWGTQAAKVNEFGLSNAPEYIQLKAGPHADPNAASKTLAKQFPKPWDGVANVWNDTTGINRVSNIVLDPTQGWTTEFWLKKNGHISASATTRYEYLLDVWNGQTGTAEGQCYGRHSLVLDGESLSANSNALSFLFASGSMLLTCTTNLTKAQILDDQWHHIAITFQSGSSPNWFELNSYLDGQHHSKVTTADQANVSFRGAVTGSLIANIGAARRPGVQRSQVAALSSGQKIDGYGKLSGSIDEFRFWKKPRTPKEISRFWFTQIGGGTNTDNNKFSGSAAPVDLGFYYKFNEGNTGDATTDATVLDYSGRISNGTWTGFVEDGSRVAGATASAMIESSASLNEFKDPIIYSSHSDVSTLLTDLQGKGKEWDLHNNSALYNTLPEWISTNDRETGGETLKKLMQIIGSYFDQLQLQVRFLPNLADKKYPLKELVVYDPKAPDYNPLGENTGKTRVHKFFNKPVPSAPNAVFDYGMITPEIFADVDSLANFASRDEKREFESKIYDIKNNIYQNIYNNLEYIYRSKGTEKAFRNFLHCWGIDEDLIKINIYANNSTFKFDDSEYHAKTIRRNYVNFTGADRKQSTIYQTASADTSEFNYLDPVGTSGSITFEADVIFPYKHPRPSDYWYEYDYLTSSIFGCHEASDTASDYTWAGDDHASFQVHALRDEAESKDIRFMLTSSNGFFPTLTTGLYKDVYDNNRWTFAVRLGPGSHVGGTKISGSLGDAYSLEFYGVNAALDVVQNEFHLSGTVDAGNASGNFMSKMKRVYAGAHRTNFTGSNIVQHTDIKLVAVSVWNDYLTNKEIKMHAFDPANSGREEPYRSAYLFEGSDVDDPNVDGLFIPKIKTQVLNWQFIQNTGSSNGVVATNHYGGSSWNSSFTVKDMTSGSDNKWNVADVYKTLRPARGDWFLPNDTGSISTEYIHIANQNLPEVMAGSDTIKILSKDDNYFTRDSVPANCYFSIEKNMAQVISKEMLDMMGSAAALNSIIGAPVNRYRQEYKSLARLREMFFRRVDSEIDFNRFIEFYKWLDQSLSDMLMELVPASANFSDGVKTMIESHILERNKYWSKFPTMEMKAEPIVGYVKGIKELTYDWKHGHAPLPDDAPATATWTFTDKGNETTTITLTDAYGISVVFEIDNDGDGAAGTNTAMDPPTNNAAGMASILIDSVNASVLKITATSGGGATGEVLLTQDVKGTVGNTTITLSNYSNWNANTTATFPLAFTGGKENEDQNCLWWSERSEASGSTSGVNAYDDQRNTIRRVTTSDITTNKIIATGEYTHPTNYPNSGLTNAAQIGLAQSGDSVATRQEYKGSTYALRRFTKPYKMDLNLSREVRSGHNLHRNNKGVDVLWAAHRGVHYKPGSTQFGSVRFDLENSQPGYDLMPTCNDNITPVELKKVKRHAAWSEEFSLVDLADGEATNARIVAPFAYHSQSSDNATGKPYLAHLYIAEGKETSYTNYHGDAYGPNQEIPLQGPFTEKHVGGRQYRHADINKGDDDAVSRLEGWSVHTTGETFFPPWVRDDGVGSYAYNSGNSAFPRGTYYRDETAKRPINIKNIKTVTGSAHGNYDHLQQVIHTTMDSMSPWFVKLHAMTGSDGITALRNGNWSNDGPTDTTDRPKLRYFAKSLIDSAEEKVPPLSPSDAGQLVSKYTMIERFSAPGGPDTAGDSGGGHGLAGPSTNYSPNNSLNYRNLAVRTPYSNLLVARCDKYGAFSGSDYFPNENTTAVTASFHKTHRNTDYRYAFTSDLTAYNSGSIAFNGSSQFYYNNLITANGTNAEFTKQFTVNMWFKTADDDLNSVFSWTRNVNPWDDLKIYVNSGRVYVRAAFGAADSGANIWKTPDTPIKTNQWHSVAVVWDQDGSDAYAPPKIYVDGKKYAVLIDTADSGGSTEGLTPLWWHGPYSNVFYIMAGLGGSSPFFNGNIQDVSIWNRPLSPSEIKDIYHLPGYDSAGPGDLTRLNYVSSNDKKNHLLHWYRFGPQAPPGETGGGTATINDFAPRHASTETYYLNVGTDGTLHTNPGDFLAANYYGVECVGKADNWHVQHPIPSNDFGYAWITASADQAVGCDLVTTASFISASDVGHVTVTWDVGSGMTKQPFNYGLMSKTAAHTYDTIRSGHELLEYHRPFQATDFAGMNTHIYEPITASSNTLGYPNLRPFGWNDKRMLNILNQSQTWDPTANITEGFFAPAYTTVEYWGTVVTDYFHKGAGTPAFQGLLSHRGSQYGYPTFKQLRTGDHPVARRHKKDNTLSIGDKATTTTFMHQGSLVKSTGLKGATFTNYTEPLVSSKYKAMVHRVDTATSDGSQTVQPVTLKHTYANNLSMFANREITNKLDCTKTDRQMYHELSDAYINPEMDASSNPIKAFKSLVYSETVYPKEQYTFLGSTRGRLNYDQTIVQKAEVRAGTETTWWRDRLEDRTRCDVESIEIYRHSGSAGSHLGYAINSMGYRVYKIYNQGSGSGHPRSLGNTVGGLGGGPAAYPRQQYPEGHELNVRLGRYGSWFSASLDGTPNDGIDHGGLRDLDTDYLHSGSVTWFLPSGALSSWPLDTGIDEPHIDDWAGDASPSGDQYGYNVGELYMDPIATLYASLSKAQLKDMLEGGNGTVFAQLNHFMAETGSNGERLYKCPGTASVCFNHFALGGTTSNAASGSLHGTNWNRRLNEPNQIMAWKANEYAGRNPFFDSYEDYSDDIRAIAKDYTVIPEFRMSEHIEHYLSSENGFKTKNYKFLSLLGGTQSSSADHYDSDYNEAFWKEYCHSDFMKYFGGIQDDHADVAGVTALSFRMSAVKKLLPYNGFYPVQRTVQLASLMSSSYGPYLSGSASASFGADSADNINSCHGGPYFAERMQSLLQPFYAPGIMFNTIKSGIAVDWACHTGSFPTIQDVEGSVNSTSPWYWQHENTVSTARYGRLNLSRANSRRCVAEAPTFRMPFEAIINPDGYLPYSASADAVGDDKHTKGSLILVAPYYGSSSFHCNWQGQSKPYYSMAANNFFAEVPNFFLQRRTMNSFTSAREAEFKPMSSGSTYYMDVVLHKTNDYVAYENFGSVDGVSQGTTTRGWGYGPSYQSDPSAVQPRNASDPSYAVFTPPYFYGAAKARIKFTPHEHMDMTECESFVFSLDDILAGATLETQYINDILPNTPGPERLINEMLTNGAYAGSIVNQHRMQVSSSVTLFGKTFKPAIEYDQNGNIISATENPQAGLGAWTIATKFECPSLNFYGKHGGAHDTDGDFPFVPETPYELVEDDYPSTAALSVYQSTYSTASVGALNQRVRGIYNGLGEIPTAGSGIFLSLKDSFPASNYDPTCGGPSASDREAITGKGSLLDVCGFRPEEKQIGVIAEQKTISEAVVAIPFVDFGGERKFFALGDTPSKSREIYLRAVNGEDGPGKSIRTMVERMQRYIFPPHLDFKTDLMMEPFAMYIFEFSHKLTQKDLSYIWQGLMPDISVTAEKAKTAITHAHADNEFFRGKPIPEETRWMVFKVKRRSRENYFALTADSQDDSQFNFKQGGKPLNPPEYTYNWPYDFFSLVEVAKLDVKAGIGDSAIPILPSPSFPLDLNPTSPDYGKVLAGGALAGAATQGAIDAKGAQAQNAIFQGIGSDLAATMAGIDKSFAKFGNIATDIATGLSPTKLADLTTSTAAGGWIGGNAGGPIADTMALLDAPGGFDKTNLNTAKATPPAGGTGGTAKTNLGGFGGGSFKGGKF